MHATSVRFNVLPQVIFVVTSESMLTLNPSFVRSPIADFQLCDANISSIMSERTRVSSHDLPIRVHSVASFSPAEVYSTDTERPAINSSLRKSNRVSQKRRLREVLMKARAGAALVEKYFPQSTSCAHTENYMTSI